MNNFDRCEAPGCRHTGEDYCAHCSGYFCTGHLRAIITVTAPTVMVCEECYRAYKQADSFALQGN